MEDVAPGRSVLVADGLVRLEVAERLEDRLRCVVVAGGELADHKGVAFPGSSLRVPPLTEKDAADIAFGRELGVDYVAMSFVRSSEDIRQVAALVEPGTPIIAKVELAAAYENLDDIMAAADGVMVARAISASSCPWSGSRWSRPTYSSGQCGGAAHHHRHRDAAIDGRAHVPPRPRSPTSQPRSPRAPMR